MIIHFETRAAAIAHLLRSGWKQKTRDTFVSRDESCSAMIGPANGDVVWLFVTEIAAEHA